MLIAGMSLLILAGLFIGYPYLTALDQGVMTLVQEHRSPMLDEVAVVFTLIGEFCNMLLFSALLTGLLLITRQWRQAIFAGSHPALHRAGEYSNQTLLRPYAPGSAERSADQLQHAQRSCLRGHSRYSCPLRFWQVADNHRECA